MGHKTALSDYAVYTAPVHVYLHKQYSVLIADFSQDKTKT